jgi:type II secretory pathway component PulK
MRASVALISLLVISSVTLIVVLAMAEVDVSSFYQYENNNSNTSAYYLGESCLEEAMHRLEEDTSFTSANITLDSNQSCSITVTATSNYSIDVNVSFYDYVQNFRGIGTISTSGGANHFTLSSWQEV